MKDSWRRLAERLGGRLAFQAPLRELTSFRVGGPARMLARPEDVGELQELLASARRERLPFIMLGGGSNLLFDDAGFDGLVIKLGAGFAGLEGAGSLVRAGAAAASADLLAWTVARDLGGLEGLAGLPGTVGGAVAGNAGAGPEGLGRAVTRLFVLEGDGRARSIPAADLNFAYRRLEGLPERAVILEAEFALTSRPAVEIRARLAEIRERRGGQPLGGRSAGCVFKNPPSISAGRLIDECGFKGQRVGGARVSEVHANFILAENGATASDILALIDRVRQGVLARRGLALELELKVLGPGGEVRA
ncbi:MAG: UDP-N-acetylmuramate dehydrogenase [Candidatus Adiutrix sp.]|jgi:UDP-N-acetylmuramate dehydrogenase|nr:UDP-N-acetylmuramate dehydrogenase [Candidatus Adiutrix sp.]